MPPPNVVWPAEAALRFLAGYVTREPVRTLLTQYLEKHWAYFHQTFNIGAFWDKDERRRVNMWGRKVTVQGHGGLQYARKY